MDKQPNAVRQDNWWITNEYLTAGAHMVASQFIEEPESITYDNVEKFRERVNYVTRQHCPIMYSFFFTETPAKTLPEGFLDIIMQLVRVERPLFMLGVETIAKGRIIE